MKRALFVLQACSLMAFGCGGGGSKPHPDGSSDAGSDHQTTTDSGSRDTGNTIDAGAHDAPIGSDAGDAGTAVDAPPAKFTVGGSVTGLLGGGLVLQNNAGDNLTVSASDATFTFATSVATGAAYNVTVSAQPTSPSQVCQVSNGSGTVGGAAVTGVVVTCTTSTFSVGGTVVGLTGAGLVLRDNGGDDLTVAANGTSFAFATKVASGAAFAVTISTQPSSPTQTCMVAGGSGTIAAADVTSVTINCTTDQFSVGGTVSGLAGTVVVEDNGGDDTTVTSNGTFAFPTLVASGQPYAVTVLTQPTSPSQTCTVSSGSGTVTGAMVTASVTCVTNTYAVKASVTGLAGSGLTVQNGSDVAPVSADGTVTVSAAVVSGAAYSVSVASQPTNQTCATGSPAAGVIGAADVTVAITCVTNTYSVAGTLSGVFGSIALNNGSDNITVPNGAFSFPTKLTSGTAYAVTVTTPLQDCIITGGSGTIAGADTAVTIACTPPLVYYFPFDGDATDQSGNGHDGMVNGATLVADRNLAPNSAYSFDGTDWIQAAGDALPLGNSDRTLTAWVMPYDNNGQWGFIYWGQNDCTGNMWGLGMQGSATYWGGCNDFQSGLALPVNTWTFVAIRFTGPNHIRVRVNSDTADNDLGTNPNTQAGNLWIGAETTTDDNTNFRNHYNGALDSIRIYDRALTDAELDTVFNTLP